MSGDGSEFINLVSGHGLLENAPLVFGAGFNVNRSIRASRYSAAAFDGYMEPADNVTLTITVRYKTLTI